MNTEFLRNLALVSTVPLTTGGANSPLYHRQVVAGQVVQVAEERAVVCIGEPGGTEVAQVLDTNRAVFRTDVVDEGEADWARERVGKAGIDGLIGEHFATIDVVEGKVLKNDIVALERCV